MASAIENLRERMGVQSLKFEQMYNGFDLAVIVRVSDDLLWARRIVDWRSANLDREMDDICDEFEEWRAKEAA